MNMTYDKELTDIWFSRAQELGIMIGEFSVDGIDFVSEEVIEDGWNTLTVYADGKEIYWEESEEETV